MATVEKIVYEFPKEEFDNLMNDIQQLKQRPLPEVDVTPVAELHGRIPVHEFAYQLQIGKTTMNLMISGKHASGFVLKTFRKAGTKQVWTLQSEVDRYFEGFGNPATRFDSAGFDSAGFDSAGFDSAQPPQPPQPPHKETNS